MEPKGEGSPLSAWVESEVCLAEWWLFPSCPQRNLPFYEHLWQHALLPSMNFSL